MALILAGMFAAFWVQYNEDQKAEAKFREDMHNKADKLNTRQQTTAQILYYDKDTSPFFKDIIYDWIKLETRGQ